ncbi:hypothetical protein [Catellatospora sp. IY07-71]|uniref:hypothetical protein n=1 Tax=Catellatospora sp. IY07-71 TaxID=2728827 RepID=UPI0035303797
MSTPAGYQKSIVTVSSMFASTAARYPATMAMPSSSSHSSVRRTLRAAGSSRNDSDGFAATGVSGTAAAAAGGAVWGVVTTSSG